MKLNDDVIKLNDDNDRFFYWRLN